MTSFSESLESLQETFRDFSLIKSFHTSLHASLPNFWQRLVYQAENQSSQSIHQIHQCHKNNAVDH
jgi:hypothetical protein